MNSTPPARWLFPLVASGVSLALLPGCLLMRGAGGDDVAAPVPPQSKVAAAPTPPEPPTAAPSKDKSALPPPTARMLVFYTTDAPSDFSRFADTFSRRMRDALNVEAESSEVLLSDWLTSAREEMANSTVAEQKLALLVDKAKVIALTKRGLEATQSMQSLVVEAKETIMNYPGPVSSWADFALWAAVAYQEDPVRFQEWSILYGRHATSAKKSKLEREVDPKLYLKIRKALYLPEAKLVDIRFVAPYGCSIFANGEPTDNELARVPLGAPSLLVASCQTGVWKSEFRPKSQNGTEIIINPVTGQGILEQPPLKYMNPNTLSLNNYNVALSVHYSKSKNLIQATLMAAPLNELGQWRWEITDLESSRNAGDELLKFVSNTMFRAASK